MEQGAEADVGISTGASRLMEHWSFQTNGTRGTEADVGISTEASRFQTDLNPLNNYRWSRNIRSVVPTLRGFRGAPGGPGAPGTPRDPYTRKYLETQISPM